MKRAFTILELIFVIIIVGILASFGAEILFKAYENYILTKTLNQNYYRLETALFSIAKRLERAIPLSCIARKESSGSDFNKIKPLKSLLPGDNYKIIECYMAAYEANRGVYDNTLGYVVPGWNGFIDLYSGDTNKSSKTLHTLGSRLSYAKPIISTLSNGKANLDAPSSNAAIIFLAYPDNGIIKAYGWDGTSSDLRIYEVYKKGEDIFGINGSFPSRVYERYNLTWTAMAFVPEYDAKHNSYKLYLYTNYRPWKGETFKNGEKYLLIDHVSTFKFRQPGFQINLKLCISRYIFDNNFTLCSERIVF